MGKVPRNARACSKHFEKQDYITPKKGKGVFKRLRETALPSKNLPNHTSPSTETKRKVAERAERLERRRLNFERALNCPLSELDHNESGIMNLDAFDLEKLDKEIQATPVMNDEPIQATPVMVEKYVQVFMCPLDMRDEEELSSATGLDSFELLDAIVCGVECYLNTYFGKDHTLHKLGVRERVIMTLLKLKQNLPFTFLAMLFRIDRRTCSRYFSHTIKILSVIMENFICTESRELINKNIPRYFANFTMCRYVLDCTEIPVCSPRCIRCQTQMYSHYKARYTLKILIGTSPSGVITYVSPFYGGKASDKFIFNSTKILDQCQQGDCIMVDKGVLIEKECNAKGVRLIQPPFKGKHARFTRTDCERGRDIAAARVHIERVNERLKNFKILHDEIQYSYLTHMNDIILVISAIVNLSSPILTDERFIIQH